jgi:acyl-CoA thioesterase
MEDLTNKAKEILKKQKGFISANNYEVVKVMDHYCELEGIITDTSTNHLGIAHGGYIFGLADTAAGIAAMTDERVAVTIDSSIQYLKAGKGSKLKAVAKALKVGKSVGFFEVLIYDLEDSLIAKANINYFYMN